MLNEITKIIMKLSELGITEVSVKADWKFISKLEWDVASKFNQFGYGYTDGKMPKNKVDISIYGIKFKAIEK